MGQLADLQVKEVGIDRLIVEEAGVFIVDMPVTRSKPPHVLFGNMHVAASGPPRKRKHDVLSERYV